MKSKPPVKGVTTVDVHSRPDPAAQPPRLIPDPPRVRIEPNIVTGADQLPKAGTLAVTSDADAIEPAPQVTVRELASADRLPTTPHKPLEHYKNMPAASLPAADAQGLRTFKGRQFVDLPDGAVAQIGVDRQTGLYRAKLQSEQSPSGPVLVRDPDSGLWQPRDDLESIIFTLSETRLATFRTDLDLTTVEADNEGLIHHNGKLYVVIHDHAYQALRDLEASSPQVSVMRIVRSDDPVAMDEANVYVATRPGRSEPVALDPQEGWVGINVAGQGGMRRSEPQRSLRQRLADRFSALLNRPHRHEARVRQLFPTFNDAQIKTWLQTLGDDVGGALSLKEAEYKTLKIDLFNWAKDFPATSASAKNQARQVALLITSCWRHETKARLRLPAEGMTLPALTADFSHVRSLELESAAWSDNADTFLGNFRGLEHLAITHCGLDKLPAAIGKLSQLKTLDLSSNNLRLDPVSTFSLSSLEDLKGLNLARNPLDTVPDFSGFSRLTLLDLSHTGISQWPNALQANRTWLKIDLSNNKLTEVPQTLLNPTQEKLAEIARINNVTRLTGNDFPPGYSNQFDDYWRRIRAANPAWLKSAHPENFDMEGSAGQRYRRLYPGKSIEDCRNYIYGLDPENAQTRLASLEQTFNLLKGQLDAWVFSGGGDRGRYIRANQIQFNAQTRDDRALARDRILACWRRETPQMLANDQTPIGLELDLGGLRLPSLPDIDVDFSHVGSLKLSNMNLSTSPEGFLTRFRHVRWLDLSHNQLRELPPAIGEMNAMTRLSLEHNQISLTVGSAQVLSTRTTLRALLLQHNPQLGIAPDFSQIPDMRTLTLANTGIDTFPTGLAEQPSLDTIDLSNNRITHIPDAVIDPPDERLVLSVRLNNVTRINNNPLSAETRNRLTQYGDRLRDAGTALTGQYNLIDSALSQTHIRDAMWASMVRNLHQTDPGGTTAAGSMMRWTADLSAEELVTRRRQWQLLRGQQGSDGLFNTLERLIQDPAGHKELQRRVWKVIDSITENSPESESLRRELFDRAGAATCCDRAAFTFANLETRTMIYNARVQARDQAQGPQLSALSRGLFRLHEVDKIASADITQREASIRQSPGAAGSDAHEHLVSEEVEIRLAYRYGLKDRLQLPGQPERVAYTHMANVSQATLDAAYTRVKALDNSPEEFEALMSREFWQDFITHKYRTQFEAQRQPFQDQQAALDDSYADKTLVIAEYEAQAKALQTSLAIKEAALTETLTRQELSEHSTLNSDGKTAAATR